MGPGTGGAGCGSRRAATRERWGCRAWHSTSPGAGCRYSATVRSVPENSEANRTGSGCPARASAASRSPAVQPSVRSHSSRSAWSGSSTPAAASSCPASARVNFRSPARISASSPSSRSRCSPSRMSCRAASTNRSCGGARITSSSSCRNASKEPSSCTSSMTSHSRSCKGARSASSRSTRPHASRSGAADTAWTSPVPRGGLAQRAATDTQIRCGSCSPRLCARPVIRLPP